MKISFWAPKSHRQSVVIYTHTPQKELTMSKPALVIISRALPPPAQIETLNFDVVAVQLMPVQHLLGALDAFRWVVFAPFGGLSLGDDFVGLGAGDVASVGDLVHVGFAGGMLEEGMGG